MDNKIQPLEIYTIINSKNHGSDKEEYTSDEEIDCNQSQQWREEFFVVELLHIVETSTHQTTLAYQYATNSLEFDQRYYVDIPQSPTLIEEQLKEIVILDEVTFKLVQETKSLPNLI
jgi:hypothetical protein